MGIKFIEMVRSLRHNIELYSVFSLLFATCGGVTRQNGLRQHRSLNNSVSENHIFTNS